MAQRDYWWIGAVDEDGKPYLLFGSDKSEIDAREKGIELLNGQDFEIRKLPTRDRGTASALWKGHKLEKTHSLKKAGERLGHEKSLKRKKRKESNTIW